MPKKDKMLSLSERLQELFADPVTNHDAIVDALNTQQEALVAIRDAAQDGLDFLTALQVALQANKLKSLINR